MSTSRPRRGANATRRRPRWLLLLGAVLAACSGPFFPVPPPENATFTSEALTDSGGQTRTFWRAHRDPDPMAGGAKFFLRENSLAVEVSSFAEADGTYLSPPFEGQLGDRIDLYFQPPSGESSQSACLILQEGAPQRCPN